MPATGSEFELIERHFARAPDDSAIRVGIGDDGAVIAPTPGTELVVTVDMLVEGRHFLPGTRPDRLGHKTLAVNLSDLAAMGAKPRFALLAGALPDGDDAWLAQFMTGFRALAQTHQVELIGGDTTRGPRTLCVTAIGEVPVGSAILRGGAASGDDIYVSGTLGDAAFALAALEGRVSVDANALARLVERLERPQPRVALGESLLGVASAALDVSDGLTGDLRHILERSRVGAVVDLDRIPRSDTLEAAMHGTDRDLALKCLLAGGDDYELCFTARPAQRMPLERIAQVLDLPLTRIGRVVDAPGLVVRDSHGTPLSTLPRAFDHFG